MRMFVKERNLLKKRPILFLRNIILKIFKKSCKTKSWHWKGLMKMFKDYTLL